ncbi:MAG: MarR family transcriptional regulator [Bacteroidales bacterium]|nr:MarR family transcriptional regulator [Bacteroidales bacterium]
MPYEQLKLDNQLCFRLYAASRLIIQAYRPHLERLGVTYPQYLVLMVLWETDNLPVNDIAKRLALETNTVTPLIQRMEREGIVTRKKGEVDTRQTFVRLTEMGRAMQQQSANIPSCMLDLLCSSGVSEKTVFDIQPQLDEIIEHLRK